MPKDRFNEIESNPTLPTSVKHAIEKLDRFERLEIGELPTLRPQAPARQPQPSAPQPAISPSEKPDSITPDKIACVHCGQANESARDTCWACFRYIKVKLQPAAPAADLTLVLDGATYKSTDQDLPPDIRTLMERIQKEGYSKELLVEWRNWRATRNVERTGTAPVHSDVQVFQGPRVTVIRIDGKTYLSDDKNMPPELRQIFDHVDNQGITPSLMEYLRQFGHRVKYRPATTADPTDGDLEFWKEVGTRESTIPEPGNWMAQQRVQNELEEARKRFAQAQNRLWPALLGTAIVVFWILLQLWR